MNFKNPLIPSGDDNVFYLAPIPVYERIFDDEIADAVYALGMKELDDRQKLMGQELPSIYDTERQESYEVNYERKERVPANR
jgi:hypothetical protein